jgi:hypothetical protein
MAELDDFFDNVKLTGSLQLVPTTAADGGDGTMPDMLPDQTPVDPPIDPITPDAGTNDQIVMNWSELMSALSDTETPRTIFLKYNNYTGPNGEPLRIANVGPSSGDITIEAFDHGNMPIFRQIHLVNVDHFRFVNIMASRSIGGADLDPDAKGIIRIEDSSNVYFEDCHLFYDVNDTKSYGFYNWQSDNVTINKCNMHHVTHGIVDYVGTNSTYTNNRFCDIFNDGIDLISTRTALVDGNSFTNFHQLGTTHRDGIQVWGVLSVVPDSLTISNNTMLLADGVWFQGVFMNTSSSYVITNLLIEHNVIYSGHIHGITVYRANSPIIRHNTVLQPHNAFGNDSKLFIATAGTTGAQITNNCAVVDDRGTSSVKTGNVTPQKDNPAADTYYGNLFVNGLAEANARKNDFRPKTPNSILIVPGSAKDIGALESL